MLLAGSSRLGLELVDEHESLERRQLLEHADVTGREAAVTAERLGVGGQRPERVAVDPPGHQHRLDDVVELSPRPFEREGVDAEPTSQGVDGSRCLLDPVHLTGEYEPGRGERRLGHRRDVVGNVEAAQRLCGDRSLEGRPATHCEAAATACS